MTAETPATHASRPADAAPQNLTAEEVSKDRFFADVANLSNEMIAAHGPDFAIGALILAARFIAEKKPFTKPAAEESCCGGAHHKGHHHHHKT